MLFIYAVFRRVGFGSAGAELLYYNTVSFAPCLFSCIFLDVLLLLLLLLYASERCLR